MLPFVARSLADSLRERIAFLESELERVNKRNDDLVNALAATNRAVVPFKSGEPRKPVAVVPHLGAFQAQKRLERQTRSAVVFPLPDTPEFQKLREKQESGGAG